MNLFGSVGQIYMFALLMLLFLGTGFGLWRFIDFIIGQSKLIKKSKNKNELVKEKGGFTMNNNGWIKLAIFSFVGIIVSIAILGFVSNSNPNGANANMYMQNGSSQMSNSQMQGNMNGGMAQNNNTIQQQMAQIQQQLNQIQQQLNGNGQMQQMPQQGSMPQMPQMPQQGSMPQGGMSNMPQMPQMPQQGSGSSSAGSSSGGSMSMPMM